MLVCEALNHSVFQPLKILQTRIHNQGKKASSEIISNLQLFETSYIFFPPIFLHLNTRSSSLFGALLFSCLF